MHDKDLLIDSILKEVAGESTTPTVTRSQLDDLVDELLAESGVADRVKKPDPKPAEEPKVKKVAKPEPEEQPSAKPAKEKAPKAKKEKSEKPKKEKVKKQKRAKVQENDDYLADITPWDQRHKAKADAVQAEEDSADPGAEGMKKSQSFFSHLKGNQPKESVEKTQVLYQKGGGVHPKQEMPVDRAVPEMTDVSTDVLQAQMDGATRQVDLVDEPTRVLTQPDKKPLPKAPEHTMVVERGVLTKHDQLTGQIRMAGFETAETPLDDEAWEEEFLNSREDKVRQFKMDNFNADQPEEPATSFEEDGEYHTPLDKEEVKYDILARRRNVIVQFTTTLIALVVALILTLVETFDITSGLLSDNPMVLLALYLGVLLVTLFVNGRMLWGGFISLFSGGDQDSPAALAMVVALLQAVSFGALGNVAAGGNSSLGFVGCGALFCVLMNLWGKRFLFSRMYNNFELIANDRVKKSIATVENKEEAFELGRGLAVGTPTVAYSRSAVNLKDFLYHSYAPDGVERSARLPMLLSLGFGVLAGVAAYLFLDAGDLGACILQVLTGFCGGVVVSLPLNLLLAGNVAFYRFGKKLRRHRVMISGFDGVEAVKGTDVLAVDASELFPAGTVTLRSIKSATNQSLDRSIMDVAGVVYMADCPLKPLFETVLQGKTNLLPQVDTLVYEEEMGISGWVMGYRVLVGTRKLMERHGIAVPDVDYEAKYNQPGLKAVYLSTQGILSAVFLVEYSISPKVKEGLQKAVDGGLTIHVYSCDPNITKEMICKMYKLPAGSVRIMGAVPRRLYKQQLQTEQHPTAALSYEGNADGFCHSVVSAMKLGRVITLASVLQILCAVLGGVLLILGLYLESETGVSGVAILLYQLLSTLVIVGIPMLMGR